MARKSRRYLNTAEQTEQTEQTKQPISPYKAGIYARISVEELEKQSSIDTQLTIAHEFIEANTDIEYMKEYIDIGYSSFDKVRPEFDNMVRDAKSGVINCIIVKDLSRFGRNYLETGHFLETVLPFLEVRFISVAEGYDSNIREFGDTLAMPLRAIINHAYSADISRKVKSVLKMKIKQGTYVSAHTPFGYKKVKTENGIVYAIDNSDAEIIKKIFGFALSGLNIYQITKRLNYDSSERIWTQKYVGRILRNNFYMGTYIAGKTDSFFIGKEVKKLPKEEWTVIEDHHPAIIDKLVFNLVGEKISKNIKNTKYNNKPTIILGVLDSKLFCADCGRKMKKVRRPLKSNSDGAYYYFCPTYTETSGGKCSRKSIREDRLKQEIWRKIEAEIQKAQEYKEKQLQYEDSIAYRIWYEDRQLKLEKIKKKLDEYTDTKIKMDFYDSLDVANGYSEMDFKSVMLYWKNQADMLKNEIHKIKTDLLEYADKKSSDCIWVRKLLKWQNSEDFSDASFHELVKTVVVFQEKIKIDLNVED